MRTLTLVFVSAVSLLSFTGCKKKGGADEAAGKMEAFAKEMCDCKDKSCGDKVNEKMAKWTDEMQKTAGKEADKSDPAAEKRITDASTKMNDCYQKFSAATPPAGDTAAPAGGTPPAGDTAAAPAGGTPPPATDTAAKPAGDTAAAPAGDTKKPDDKKAGDKKPDDKKAGGW